MLRSVFIYLVEFIVFEVLGCWAKAITPEVTVVVCVIVCYWLVDDACKDSTWKGLGTPDMNPELVQDLERKFYI